jgi:hypothetical protein
MSHKNSWHIRADIPEVVRKKILAIYKPKFPNVYANGITYAYKSPADYSFPQGLLDVEVVGHHMIEGRHEALVVKVGPMGLAQRPDGKLFHITLSCADGVPPAEAGDINRDLKRLQQPAKPLRFQVQFIRRKLWQSKPQRLAA